MRFIQWLKDLFTPKTHKQKALRGLQKDIDNENCCELDSRLLGEHKEAARLREKITRLFELKGMMENNW